MLSELSIKNFAIIDDLKVSFQKGLNILTGETGAGKSIIVDAIMFVLGCKASQDFIRSGTEQTQVEALFEINDKHPVFAYLSESGIDCEDRSTLIFKRIFSQKGKNSVFINNQRCTLTILSGAGEQIVDIHGQNSHQQILKEEFQIEVIDSYGNLLKAKSEIKDIFGKLASLKLQSGKLTSKINDIKSRRELLRFQTDEIEKAQLENEEEETLVKEREILKNSLTILDALSRSSSALYESESSAFTIIGDCSSIIKQQSKFDGRLAKISSRLEELSGELDDICREIEKYSGNLSFDESRLNEIEERLHFIQGLKRKYSASVEEIIRLKEDKGKELESIDIDSELLKEIEKEIDVAGKKLHSLCADLSDKRQKTALKIEKEICRELAFLRMDKVKFKIDFTSGADFISQSGMDKVTFLISTNQGESLKPLSSVASGGELARFMLSVRSIIAKFYDMPVVIFDEIDAGIGGVTAEKVGEKLKEVSKEREVLCITHFPQIAKFATTHYQISKKIAGNRTLTDVKKLSKTERIEELARMLGGNNISAVSRKHAEEMLKNHA